MNIEFSQIFPILGKEFGLVDGGEDGKHNGVRFVDISKIFVTTQHAWPFDEV